MSKPKFITRAAFTKFCKDLGENKFADTGTCPLDQAMGTPVAWPSVGRNRWEPKIDGQQYLIPMPRWAQRFVTWIDVKRWCKTTGNEAVKFLNSDRRGKKS